MVSDWDLYPPRDEAEAYIRRRTADEPPPGSKPAIGGRVRYVSMGPAEATAEHKAMLDERQRNRSDRVARRRVLETEYGAFFERKAAQLAETGRATISTDLGVVEAALVRFSDGSSVLETYHTGPNGDGHGMQRMDPEILEGNPVSAQLISTVLYLGPGARPLSE